MKEIVYQESASGVFKPVPTRAEKRAAKLAAEKRAKKMEAVWGAIGITVIGICYAALFGLSLFAEHIWPMR